MTASAKPAASLPKAGDLIANKYRVERMIGAGGMGAVYVAVHELLRERVAIKVLLPEVVSDRDAVTRFINEARNATRIRNEHVAQVKDVDTLPSGAPYMIMDYLEGHDLGQCQRVWGPVPIAPAVDYILQTLEALAEAHAIGVIHRDLKPANLFLTKSSDGSDCIKVLDFGISKSTDLTAPLADGGGVTNTKAVLGSPGYMSPEQIKNARHVDARSDIWSIGVILYKLLTNHKPFNGDTMGEVFAAIFEETPQPIRIHRPDVPPVLEQIIIGGCLQRNRDQRFRNVAELAAALAPFGLPASNLSVERIRRRLAAQERAGDKSVSKQVSQMAGTMAMGQVDPSAISQASQSQGSQSHASQSHASQSQASTSQSHSSVSNSHSSVSHQSQASQGTAAPWAQTADGVPQSGAKGWLVAALVLLTLLVAGGGVFAAKTYMDKHAARATPDEPRRDLTQATATQTQVKPTQATATNTGAPADSALSIESLPTVKPTPTAMATQVATDTSTAKPTSTATSRPTSSAKPKDSAPSDDVLKMRR